MEPYHRPPSHLIISILPRLLNLNIPSTPPPSSPRSSNHPVHPLVQNISQNLPSSNILPERHWQAQNRKRKAASLSSSLFGRTCAGSVGGARDETGMRLVRDLCERRRRRMRWDGMASRMGGLGSVGRAYLRSLQRVVYLHVPPHVSLTHYPALPRPLLVVPRSTTTSFSLLLPPASSSTLLMAIKESPVSYTRRRRSLAAATHLRTPSCSTPASSGSIFLTPINQDLPTLSTSCSHFLSLPFSSSFRF